MPSKGMFSSFNCCKSLPADANAQPTTTATGGCCSAANIQEFKEDVGDALDKAVALANKAGAVVEKIDAAIPTVIFFLDAAKILFEDQKDIQAQITTTVAHLQAVHASYQTTKKVGNKVAEMAAKPLPTTLDEMAGVVKDASSATEIMKSYAEALKDFKVGDTSKLDAALVDVQSVLDKTNKYIKRVDNLKRGGTPTATPADAATQPAPTETTAPVDSATAATPAPQNNLTLA